MSKQEIATFAGGCFWCMQPLFDQLEGVLSTTVGYTGGTKENPTYEEVCSGTTGHAEAIQVVFDPTIISYEKLLWTFWHHIDPTTQNKQFFDTGTQYRTSIFYHSPEQKQTAELTKEKIINQGVQVVTEIAPSTIFYPAENYHQKYCDNNPQRYIMYHEASERDKKLKKIWKVDE